MNRPELDARRAAGETLQIIDVRSGRDYAKSHVPGAINIPLAEIRGRIDELDPHTPTIAYCNVGVSGNAGQNILLRHGFTTVFNLSGGNSNYQAHQRLRVQAEAGQPRS